ncbi:LLM class flavin-dependent oxidoreductase [Streptococcus dentapri]|uniref:LLM class flavin-dependent oxidoreductase n=1 Tax=Streptococcus dentapri TaxID=573564 RepID=A0ABV8D2D3_9STRE
MKISVLNLVPLRQGQTYREAMTDMVDLAQKIEQLGYERLWIAEHHNMKSIGSSATVLLMQHALAHTQKIRVGSGGIMLPNHSPYIVAEQFGTLETLYPGRVDLGLGRAPGTDMKTAQALRRTDNLNPRFAEDVTELAGYFSDTNTVHAYPAAGLQVPFYILGSSTDSAYLAAEMGLPYSFASHFAPAMMEEALAIYRRYFRPSAVLARPYVILGANAVLADSDEEAQRLATTQLKSFLGIVTGHSSGLQPPLDSEDDVWQNYLVTVNVPHFGPLAFEREDIIHREKMVVKQMSQVSLIGSPALVQRQLAELRERVEFDELIVNSYIYDKKAQHRSFELLKGAADQF